MPLPSTPVIPGHDQYERTFGGENYNDLPAYPLGDQEGTIITRWHFTWRERLSLLWTGDLYLWIMTFYSPLQPILFTVKPPDLPPESRALKLGKVEGERPG